MAYDLRHTGAEIDEAIYAVERGSVVTENTVKEVTFGEAKPASADAIAKELQKKVNKIEGKGLSTNDYTDAEMAQVAKIEGKQDTLTLTVKDNGNIVLGNIAGQTKEFMPATPSGDPMHYAYVTAGATWNASTGYWEYRKDEGGLDDLTNEDMRVCYSEAWLNSTLQPGIFFNVAGRTTINRAVWTASIDLTNAYRGVNLEVIFVKGMGSEEAIPKNTLGSFGYCPKLKRIANTINLTYGTRDFEIKGSPLLEYIRLKNIKKNVDIAQCPKISKDSLLYMIHNSAATSAITIKVHADVYAKHSADTDIVAALAAQPLVTLISA